MSNIPPCNYRNVIQKWLFAVVLLVGFAAVSGTPVQVQPDQSSLKTTLVVNPISHNGKTLSYARAVCSRSPAFHFSLTFFNISLLHTLQVKTRLTMLPVYFAPQSQTRYFCHLKSSPQHTGDDPAICLG